jgi:hypothetical protein
VKHERFEELCALALIGQLPASEHAEFRSHMRVCEACRTAASDFAEVLELLPVEQVPIRDYELIQLQEKTRTEHFLAHARGAGIVFSRDALQPARRKRSIGTFLTTLTFVSGPAVAAVIVLVIAGLSWFILQRKPLIAHPQFAVAETGPTVINTSRAPSVEPSNTFMQIDDVRHEMTLLKDQLTTARKNWAAAESQLREDNELVTKLRQEIGEKEYLLAQSALASKQAQAERDDLAASLVAQRVQTQTLETELQTASTAIEQERELTSAAREVRELMGARNLHIIDVYDNAEAGSSKSFGRVIYTEGKSLIFYAFDLDRKRRGRRVSFQAWGEHDGEHRDPKRLGVFYIDDEIQKRWVLKIKDPAKLKAVDTVFVTVEALNAAEKPSGQRFLQAYLGSQPNHP